MAVFVSLITVQILFGLNYVWSKVLVDLLPPLVWASFRMVVAGVLLLGLTLLLKRPMPKGGWSGFLKPVAILSLFGVVLNQSSFLLGLHYTTPTNSAVLSTLIPVFTLLIVTIRKHEPFTAGKGFGFLLALVGVLSLRKFEEYRWSNHTAIGDLLTVFNCVSYAIFLSYGKKFLERFDRLWVTSLLFLFGSLGITLMAAPDWVHFQVPALSGAVIWFGVLSIVGGTLLTYFLNNYALAYAKSSHVALFIYVQPVIAAGYSWIWYHEPITMRTFISVGLIFLGMLAALGR